MLYLPPSPRHTVLYQRRHRDRGLNILSLLSILSFLIYSYYFKLLFSFILFCLIWILSIYLSNLPPSPRHTVLYQRGHRDRRDVESCVTAFIQTSRLLYFLMGHSHIVCESMILLFFSNVWKKYYCCHFLKYKARVERNKDTKRTLNNIFSS